MQKSKSDTYIKNNLAFFPIRILVPSESVGAIIGKGGETISNIAKTARAKLDVYRGDPIGQQEKQITIWGLPENCINACREILKVMKSDAISKDKPSEFPIKMLTHNDYIGFIIGKQGNIINSIKKETETSVNIYDMRMNVDKVVCIKGEQENMIKALEIIYLKIKTVFDSDNRLHQEYLARTEPRKRQRSRSRTSSRYDTEVQRENNNNGNSSSSRRNNDTNVERRSSRNDHYNRKPSDSAGHGSSSSGKSGNNQYEKKIGSRH